MEIFSYRLPALTFKKLSEKTGFDYIKDHYGRMKIGCYREQFNDFITGNSTSAKYEAEMSMENWGKIEGGKYMVLRPIHSLTMFYVIFVLNFGLFGIEQSTRITWTEHVCMYP
jgi:hypothetical protein